MRKNGFIATSLLYSFFLVFCALLVGLVGNYLHNQILLNNVIDGVKEDLSRKLTIADVKVGDRVKMPLFIYGKTTDTEWIVSDNNGSSATIVSTGIEFTTNLYNSTEELNSELRTYHIQLTGNEIAVTYLNNMQITNFKIIKDDEENKVLGSALLARDSQYLYLNDDDNNFYLYNTNSSNIYEEDASKKIDSSVSAMLGMRFSAILEDSVLSHEIQSGKGISSDPYIIK